MLLNLIHNKITEPLWRGRTHKHTNRNCDIFTEPQFLEFCNYQVHKKKLDIWISNTINSIINSENPCSKLEGLLIGSLLFSTQLNDAALSPMNSMLPSFLIYLFAKPVIQYKSKERKGYSKNSLKKIRFIYLYQLMVS